MACGAPTTPPPVPFQPLGSGWSLVRDVTPAISGRARDVLFRGYKDYGEGEVALVGGRLLAFRREPHFDDHVDGVCRWHPGITVYESANTSLPAPVGMTDMRAGRRGPSRSDDETALSDKFFVAGAALLAIGGVAGYLLWRGERS